MPPAHPPYPPELKHQMVKLVRAGRSPAELAKELSRQLRPSNDIVAEGGSCLGGHPSSAFYFFILAIGN